MDVLLGPCCRENDSYQETFINPSPFYNINRIYSVCHYSPQASALFSNTFQLLSLINDYNYITITGPVEM